MGAVTRACLDMRRLTAIIGLICHSVGYSAVWLIASGRIVVPYWLLIAFGLMASSGDSFASACSSVILYDIHAKCSQSKGMRHGLLCGQGRSNG